MPYEKKTMIDHNFDEMRTEDMVILFKAVAEE